MKETSRDRITDTAGQIRIGGNVTGQVAIGDFVYQAQAPGGVINQIIVTEPIRALPRPIDVRPRPRRDDIERTAIVGEIIAVVGREPCQIIARDGWGKTSVVAQLAHHVTLERYRDGVAAISGWGLPVEDIEQAIFDAFYESTLPDTVHKVTPGQLRTSLASIEAAILVDDLDIPRQHVDRLIDSMSDNGFISTASTQTMWSGGAVVNLEGMNEADSLALFQHRLGRAIKDPELEAVLAFIAHVRGFPMAVVAAASAVRRGVALVEALPRLVSAPDPIAAVHEEIAATFSLAESRILSVLAAVQGDPLPPEAIGHTAGVDDADALLDGLENDGIIQAASPRYRLPRSSAALLGLTVDEPATARGLTTWCDTVDDADLITGAGPAIVSAIHSAARASDNEAAMALGRSADGALSLSGRWGVWGQVLEATRDASSAAGNPFMEAWSLHQLGTRALAEQRPDDASTMLASAAEIRRQIGDQAGLRVTEHNLSFLNPIPPAVPPKTPPHTPPPSGGIPWWAWTMMVVGLLAIAGVIGFVVVNQESDPTVVTTLAVLNGELVPTTDVIEILDVPPGASISSEVELFNVGRGPVDINDVAVDGPESITVGSSCNSLEPGESCLVTITFSPIEPGEAQGVLGIRHSGVNNDVSIPVIAFAIDPPEAFLSVDPVNLDFGVIPLGEDGSRSIEIANVGNVEVGVSGIRIDSRFFVRDQIEDETTDCASLPPGDSCSVGVRLVGAGSGAIEGILTIAHSGDNSPLEVRLSGVIPEPPNLVIEIVEVTDAATNKVSDPLAIGKTTIAITNAGQTATSDAFEYRIERLNPQNASVWLPALDADGNQTRFTVEGSIGPGETIVVEPVLGFPTRDYIPGSTTEIRAEVDSCFAEEFIEVPPCRVGESNEEDNVSDAVKIRVFYEVIQ